MPTTNYSAKQLNFGIDRILSDEIAPASSDKSRVQTLPLLSSIYSYTSSIGNIDFFPSETNRCYYQPAETQTVTSAFGNVFRNCSNIVRPSPVRPIIKESVPTSTSQIENNSSRRRSWSRAVFSSLQRKGLEKRFAIQKYITKPDRRQLAATLGLTDAQVKVWFQNRRMKWRHTKEDKKTVNTQDDIRNKSTSSSSSTSQETKGIIDSDEDVDVESNL